jgi:rare lipoprotein A
MKRPISALLLLACAAGCASPEPPQSDEPRVVVAHVVPDSTLERPDSLAVPPAPIPFTRPNILDAEDFDPADFETREGQPHEEGEASYYGYELAGRPTATGEPFDPNLPTAAHRTLPLGSIIRVTNVRNGESVVVRVNDRGPFHGNRVLDLSRSAAMALGFAGRGTGRVEIERL